MPAAKDGKEHEFMVAKDGKGKGKGNWHEFMVDKDGKGKGKSFGRPKVASHFQFPHRATDR